MNINEAENLFKKFSNKYVQLKNDVESEAIQNIWSSGIMIEVEPYELNRMGLTKGKILKSHPKKTKGKCLQMFNSKGDLLCRRVGTEIDDCFFEEFFFYKESRIESVYFNASRSKVILNAKIRHILNGDINQVITYGKYGNRFETFIYKNGKLSCIEVIEYGKTGESSTYQVIIDTTKGIQSPTIRNLFPNGRSTQVYP